MAYTVSQRIPEIGVRMAVGASPGRVVAMVVWQGAQLALAGLGLGLIASVFAAVRCRACCSTSSGLDPLTFAIAPVVLVVAALLASYIPARRASRITPLFGVRAIDRPAERTKRSSGTNTTARRHDV